MGWKTETVGKIEKASAKLDKKGVRCVTPYQFAKACNISVPTARKYLKDASMHYKWSDISRNPEPCFTIVEIAHRPNRTKMQYCLNEGISWAMVDSLMFEIPF